MREELIQTALGQKEPDLVLKNAKVINVFSKEILDGNIAVSNGYIAGVGDYSQGKKIIDLKGRYVAPGFLDAHCHVESSMVVPSVYCAEAARKGVTTLITDPHEIANVSGAMGIRFMLDSSKSCPMNYYVQLPSCVPATSFEHNGSPFTSENMLPFLEEPRVLGLGEMMNYPGVAGCDPEVMKKIELFRNRVVDGHAPELRGRDLQAYVAAGIETDHENDVYDQALEKLRAGLAVLVREGSACKNLQNILEGVLRDKLDTTRMAFCTDDKHLADIRQEGSILHCVKLAVSMGMEPVQAIQMATINGAKIYGLKDIGAIAPGYRADMVILDDLEQFNLFDVYKDGIRVSEYPALSSDMENLEEITKTVNLPSLTESSFCLPHHEIQPVITLIKGQVSTKKSEISGELAAGLVSAGRLRKIAVIERHHASGNIGVGLIEGYGLFHGAVGSTVAHDSHNMIIVGDNNQDMLAAAKELERVQGGYTLAVDGKILGTLPLPVGGLMSFMPAETFIPALDEMIKKAREAGVSDGIDPFITLSFMALPVIPELRITDMGVFDVTSFRFI